MASGARRGPNEVRLRHVCQRKARRGSLPIRTEKTTFLITPDKKPVIERNVDRRTMSDLVTTQRACLRPRASEGLR
jgi:hypothetical protein